MRMESRVLQVIDYLEEIIPNPKTELNYTSDYTLLLAIMLSAQTTDERVNKVTPILFSKYKNLDELANASLDDVKEIIRPLGSFNKKSEYLIGIAREVSYKYNGVIPKDRELLESLPGIGRKTVNVFLNEYYNIPQIAVDTHIERVSKRLALVNFNDNVYEVEKKLKRRFKKDTWGRRHLQLLLFGRYRCKAISPNCKDCKLIDICKEKKKTI